MLRLGVLGCGAIGAFHARVVAQKRDVVLAGLCDTDGQRSAALAARLGTRAWTEPQRFLAEAGLVFDLLLEPTQMPLAAALIRRLPGLRVVLEHAGSPGDAVAWAPGIATLAALALSDAGLEQRLAGTVDPRDTRAVRAGAADGRERLAGA